MSDVAAMEAKKPARVLSQLNGQRPLDAAHITAAQCVAPSAGPANSVQGRVGQINTAAAAVAAPTSLTSMLAINAHRPELAFKADGPVRASRAEPQPANKIGSTVSLGSLAGSSGAARLADGTAKDPDCTQS